MAARGAGEGATGIEFADAHTHWHEVVEIVEEEGDTHRESAAATLPAPEGTPQGGHSLASTPLPTARQALIDGAVSTIVCCGCNPSDWDRTVHFRDRIAAWGKAGLDSSPSTSPVVIAGVGVHPWWAAPYEAQDARRDMIEDLGSRIRADPDLTVGEIGLDKSKGALLKCALEVQLSVFREQFELACETRRPVSIHCVRAHEELTTSILEILQQRSKAGSPLPSGILFHSWPGPPHIVKTLCDTTAAMPLKLVFSFQGTVVHAVIGHLLECLCKESLYDPTKLEEQEQALSKAGPAASKQTMSVVASLPPGFIAFETDAPYQSFWVDCEVWVQWAESVARLLGLRSCSDPCLHSPCQIFQVVLAVATWRSLKSTMKGPTVAPAGPSSERFRLPSKWPSAETVADSLNSLARAGTENWTWHGRLDAPFEG